MLPPNPPVLPGDFVLWIDKHQGREMFHGGTVHTLEPLGGLYRVCVGKTWLKNTDLVAMQRGTQMICDPEYKEKLFPSS